MLEIFKDKQPLFYEEISNSINNKKIVHAYLIETNGYKESNDLIIAFIKDIFHSFIDDEDKYLNISNLIDEGAFADFISVEPDGNFIKKEQILEIKEKFKTTSIDKEPRIYLINEADKLNKYAANSLLKFLEEPDGDVIAVLVTDNRYKVLETIRSRCQIYTLINLSKKIDISEENSLVNLIETFENKGQASIAYLSGIVDSDSNNKEFWLNTFKNMINIYENTLRKLENVSYDDYGKIMDIILQYNDVNGIIKKIDVLFKTISNLEFNLNINMMLDKFIIEFTGGV